MGLGQDKDGEVTIIGWNKGNVLGKTQGPQALLPDLLILAPTEKSAGVSGRTGRSAQPLPSRRGTTGVYRLVYLQIY